MIVLLLALVLPDCASCHRAIAESFAKTPMAQSSGPVTSIPPGEYRHAPSQTTYRIASDGKVDIRTPAQTAAQMLAYFIGSGAHGQSYLFLRAGKLFQAPVTHYSGRGWAMSPGYEQDTNSDWTRSVDRDCLWCHASSARPIFGTVNQYADPPFAQNGVTCERCHGDARDHALDPRRLPFNPVKLEPRARNDTCRQCHMIGTARTNKPGRSFYEYVPGRRLDEMVTYQTAPQERRSDLKVTGHFERLAMSKCQIASGEKLWCGTCHNPHPVRTGTDLNQPCLTCHTPATCQRGPDCQLCHMPKAPSPEAGHSVFTDHWIR